MSSPEGPRAALRRFKNPDEHNGLEHVVYYTVADAVPSDLFAYGREAMFCFVERRYIASIAMATAAVELILNRDSRMPIGARSWKPLNAELLRLAGAHGLPVGVLLDQNENLRDIGSATFVKLRNRLAHGNLEDVIEFRAGGPVDYNQEARQVALGQLNKEQAFTVEWFNTAPDIQNGQVVGHRWPERAARPGG